MISYTKMDQEWGQVTSLRKNGRQPFQPDGVLKKMIRPALLRAGINKRFGWHTFRHSLATNLRSLGEDIKVSQELLRYANSRITLDIYTQAVPADKHQASQRHIELLTGSVPLRTVENGRIAVSD